MAADIPSIPDDLSLYELRDALIARAATATAHHDDAVAAAALADLRCVEHMRPAPDQALRPDPPARLGSLAWLDDWRHTWSGLGWTERLDAPLESALEELADAGRTAAVDVIGWSTGDGPPPPSLGEEYDRWCVERSAAGYRVTASGASALLAGARAAVRLAAALTSLSEGLSETLLYAYASLDGPGAHPAGLTVAQRERGDALLQPGADDLAAALRAQGDAPGGPKATLVVSGGGVLHVRLHPSDGSDAVPPAFRTFDVLAEEVGGTEVRLAGRERHRVGLAATDAVLVAIAAAEIMRLAREPLA